MDPWPSYQQRVRWLLVLSLVAIVLLALGAWRWPSLVALGVVLLIVAVIAGTALETLPCPRCSKPFFRSGLVHNSFSSYCLHCELPKWCRADGTLSSAKRRSDRNLR
jgi:uncharacterized membrane protein